MSHRIRTEGWWAGLLRGVLQVLPSAASAGLKNLSSPREPTLMFLPADDWSSKVFISDSCVVSELPVFPAAHASPLSPGGVLVRRVCVCVCGGVVLEKADSSSAAAQSYADLQLTEEEQKLLSQEGVSLPTSLPLTKVYLHPHPLAASSPTEPAHRHSCVCRLRRGS